MFILSRCFMVLRTSRPIFNRPSLPARSTAEIKAVYNLSVIGQTDQGSIDSPPLALTGKPGK